MKQSFLLFFAIALFSCSSDNNDLTPVEVNDPDTEFDFSGIFTANFDVLPNYSNQNIPNYITRDNTGNNSITDEGAMLGRVLFYDKNLSVNNSISCASCHKQEFAFSDDAQASLGVNGVTGRHSMRLVNARFSDEARFFWDERANTLETQTTMPIQDHVEMGFSGENGDLSFNDLITRLEGIDYYPELFNRAFGNASITEARMQDALAQFIRSIQSFDSKYDEGRVNANNDGQPFANFTQQENLGKQLFLQPPVFNNEGIRTNGGIGCAGCHQAPEFSIIPNSLNNGVIGSIDNSGADLDVTRSPTLRDVVKANGTSNGQFMHIGASNNLVTVLNHYNDINLAGNANLDPRLRPNGNGQQLNLTDEERNAVIAFMRTLAGNDVYTNEKWSNPFINE
ncbi:cytochrome-c peroxidase [Winogradskyella haliclonae]|uniref:Cytochrome-c peroxidase n=1 Tax=Winogradskyella haliclonae TaxID=2048558 RepID=A0ABQ2BXT8_9FLAO|nr:cytochrome c peroxidase [Winogradskyella haliclonae]GGI57317.1 cytochrome-c peroxidase [Winogradskyella haliclonae]